MNFDDYPFLPLKVTRTEPCGKRTFDRAGKRMLIAACLRPGVSISGMALKAGINANQLHKWIRSGQRSSLPNAAVASEPAPPAFMPVLQVDCAQAQKRPATAHQSALARSASPVRLLARLPNGVAVELECTTNDAALVAAVIAALGAR